jgi:hypothetical protein
MPSGGSEENAAPSGALPSPGQLRLGRKPQRRPFARLSRGSADRGIGNHFATLSAPCAGDSWIFAQRAS